MTLSDRLFAEGVFAQGIGFPDRRRATRRASARSSPRRTRATSCSSRSTSFGDVGRELGIIAEMKQARSRSRQFEC